MHGSGLLSKEKRNDKRKVPDRPLEQLAHPGFGTPDPDLHRRLICYPGLVHQGWADWPRIHRRALLTDY